MRWNHQLRIKDEYIHKIDFKTRYGHYDFTILPFGLANALATFMMLMNNVFMDYLDKFLLVFLEDILISSKNEEKHLQHLRIVLQHLREHKIYGKLSKCTFFQKKVQYLGHVISIEGIAINPTKIKAILEWLTLKNMHEV